MANRPRLTPGGGYVSDKMAASMIALLGGSHVDQNYFTRDQVKHLAKMYGFDMDVKHPLEKEGAFRNMTRLAKIDGYRIMAFMARFCEFGEDPLSIIKLAMSDAGYDAQLEDHDFEDVDEDYQEPPVMDEDGYLL